MRVNCNISAIIANNQLGKSENSVSQAIERLSSGLRINHAKDDASGMAISKKMHAQIRALEQSSRNTQDGVSVVQTAESALGEVENMLQRMRELAVQAATDTNGSEDREAIQLEMDELSKEIDRISTDTEYNTMPLLDGTLSRRAYAKENNVDVMKVSDTVTSGDYSISVTAAARRAEYSLINVSSIAVEGSVTINGAGFSVGPEDTADSIYEKFQDACEKINATVEKSGGNIVVRNKEYGKYEELNIKFSSEAVAAAFTGSTAKEITETGTDCTANVGAGFSSTASVSTDGTKITIKDVDSFEMVIDIEGDTTYADCLVKVTDIGILSIQAGANEGQQIDIDIPEINMHTLELDFLNVRTSEGAGKAITKLDKAINTVSLVRSKLGAYQNRLETSTESLDEYNENITAGLSRIEDCDMAEEMTEFTSQNVKNQAATSILAQANERPESILQLLQ